MADKPCPECAQPVPEHELFCPDCGAAQIPQYSHGQLRQALGNEREGPGRTLPVMGCGLGLLVGIGLAALVSYWWQADADDWLRWRLQAEIVFVLMIIGVLGGLIVQQWRSMRRRRR
jgi:hypothetical protein